MKYLSVTFFLIVACMASGPLLAADVNKPMQKIGTLHCRVLPHTGLNLLVHSTREMLCEYSAIDGSRAAYKGETGIGFGLDIDFSKQSRIDYAVLASSADGEKTLSGKYSGAGGSAALGLNAGDSTPIVRDDREIALQPVTVRNQGLGASLGFTYIYLEPDKTPAGTETEQP